ncbi:TonB-dependent receptor [Pyxidicoccus fallax]|uniref:TonB-dependent receptor n=1 Tax=Pyxidicoccus fallax TaxID=394095 RepID=A0A848L508_9BACT|nr:TonB-dependent receptor [Pyxidicoccus fallax]NMO14050.1 TonB-dependent receptor [Pyxidicoccus fallax]NPC82241.1 TonB-dependent receptor [Pyxidicoccus fallax]
MHLRPFVLMACCALTGAPLVPAHAQEQLEPSAAEPSTPPADAPVSEPSSTEASADAPAGQAPSALVPRETPPGNPVSAPTSAPGGTVEPESGEEPVIPSTVVTATRRPRPTSSQPRAMSVVTREDLAKRPARTTPEALLESEGVFLQKTNHGGGAPILRGLYGQHVLLLVDGVRLNNGTVRSGPNQYLNTVDPFLVEQLEVVRGPGSVLYGSDALGGVINVRTFWPRFASETTPIGAVRAQAGSADQSLQGHLRAGVSLQDTAVAGALTLRDFNDLRGGERVGVQRYTGYQEGDAALKVRQRLRPGLQLYLQYQGVRQSDAPRLDRSAPGDFRRFSDQERDFAHARLEHTGSGFLRRGAVELSMHRQSEQVDRFRVARDRMDRDSVNVWTVGLRAEAETPALSALPGAPVPIFGAEVFHDKATSNAGRSPLSEPALDFSPVPEDARYPGAPTQVSAGVFGLLASDAERPFSYHAGLRAQVHRVSLPVDARLTEAFPDASDPLPVLPATTQNSVGLAGELGVRQRVADGVSVLLNLGSGFRAPNIDDYLRLGADGPGYLVPGRDLHPEQSYTAELGTRVDRGPVGAQLFYAFTVVDGLVGNVPTLLDGQQFTPDGVPYRTRQNLDRADIHSLEASVSVKVLPSLTLATHATYTHTKSRRQDLTVEGTPFIREPLSRTPPLNGLVRATWEPGEVFFVEGLSRWALSQDAYSAADLLDIRTCAETPECAQTPGFVVFHARAGARLGKRLSAALTLQNLFDATYRTHGSGVDEPGRSAVISLEASL